MKRFRTNQTLRLLCATAVAFCITVAIGATAYAQRNATTTIAGTVSTEEGEPLVGANIVVKGTTTGVATDVDGAFELAISLPATLSVSFIGYITKTVTVSTTGPLALVLEPELGFFLENITVTARKRVEGIQETPISITAIRGSLLEEIGAEDLATIGDMAPNLSFSTTGAVSGPTSAAVVFIRGVGQADYVPVADPGVGIYVDEVYLGRTIGAVLDVSDLKSVEVIRGPQGTLFGRNTIGGALSLTSNDPGTAFSGRFSLTGGTYARNDAMIALGGPIANGVGWSFNAVRKNRRGYVERVNVADSWLGNDNMHGFKTKLNLAKPNSKFSLKFIADYIVEREESAPEQNFFFHDDRTIPQTWNTGGGISTAQGYVPGDITAGTDIYDERQNLGKFKTGETSLSQNDIDAYGVSANMGYGLGAGGQAKLILAYRKLDAAFARQVDGSPLDVFENRDVYVQDQVSADLRYTKSSDKLTLVSGLFYFQENIDNELNFAGVLNGAAWPVYVGGLVENANYAAYGEATYQVAPTLSLTGGLRYTNEIKRAKPDAYSAPGSDIGQGRPIGPGAIRDTTNNPTRLLDKIWQENAFDQVTWRLNAAYSPTDNLNIYGTVSTGFKSGGFEWRVTNASFYNDPTNDIDGDGDGDLPQFDPETVTTYEAGLKWDAPKTDLRVNVALFFTQYDNMQIAANPPGSIATFQTNAGDGEITGLEADVVWVPSNAVMVNVGYGLIDARYVDLIDGVTVSKDDQFILTPRHHLSFGASYRHALPNDASIVPRLDGHYKSEMHFEPQNSAYVFDDGHLAMNAAIKYNSGQRWGLVLGVDNLTNERYVIGGDANNVIGYENGIYARPRNYYATLTYAF